MRRSAPASGRPRQLSRSGSTSPLGKLDDELPKQRISSLTKSELQRQANECDMPLAEYIRVKLDVIAFGPDMVRRMHRERADLVVGMGFKSDSKNFLP